MARKIGKINKTSTPSSGAWNKHLRPDGKRMSNKIIRRESKKDIKKDDI